MRSKVAIPVDDLTREQLIKELRRLDGVIHDYESKTDQEVRGENAKLWKQIYQDGAQLEIICDTLLHFKLGAYTHTDRETMKQHGGKGLISDGVRKLAYMKEDERQAILEDRRRESAEFAKREAERKAKSVA